LPGIVWSPVTHLSTETGTNEVGSVPRGALAGQPAQAGCPATTGGPAVVVGTAVGVPLAAAGEGVDD
jgi:hypothetical protein